MYSTDLTTVSDAIFGGRQNCWTNSLNVKYRRISLQVLLRSLCQHEHFFYSYFQAEDIYTTTNL